MESSSEGHDDKHFDFLCPGIKGKEKFFQTLVSQNVHFTNISFFSVWIITFRGWSEQVKIVHVWLHIIIQFHIRSPRIFAVTTTTSLSTFNTQTLCYSLRRPKTSKPNRPPVLSPRQRAHNNSREQPCSRGKNPSSRTATASCLETSLERRKRSADWRKTRLCGNQTFDNNPKMQISSNSCKVARLSSPSKFLMRWCRAWRGRLRQQLMVAS